MCSLIRSILKNGTHFGPCLSRISGPNCVLDPNCWLVCQRKQQHQQHRFVSNANPQALFDKVNEAITSNQLGQTFAIIHLYGKEYLVHLGDIISVQKSIPAEIGQTIKLEKCLLVGSENFTLVGRPVLNRDLVQVEATLIEKTMTQTYFNMYAIPRNHGFRRYKFQRFPLTMLRISEIAVCHQLNTTQKRIN